MGCQWMWCGRCPLTKYSDWSHWRTSFQIVSGEKPTNTTVVSYISTGGMTMSPLVIFKAARIKTEWCKAAPTGYMIPGSASGYINAKLFQEYGKQFVRFVTKKILETGKCGYCLTCTSHISSTLGLWNLWEVIMLKFVVSHLIAHMFCSL